MAGIDALSALLGGTGTTPTNDITAFNQQVLAQDPFGIAGKSIDSFQPNMSSWSPVTSGITSFTKNFLSGLLGSKAQSDAADQTTQLNSVLSQLQGPNAENVQNPGGLDEGPFQTIKANEIAKRDATNADIRKAFASVGLTVNPDGTASRMKMADGSDVQDALTDFAAGKAKDVADAKGKTATGNRAMIGLAQDASKLIGGVAALNTAKDEVKNFYGARTFGSDSSLGAAIDWLGSLVPNTNAFQYNKDLPSLNDPVTQAIAGATKQGTLIQNKPMLTQSFGQTADSMAVTDQKTQSELASKLATYISTLEAAGWPQTDAPNGLPSLDDLRQKYDQVASGQGLTPPTSTTSTQAQPAPTGQFTKSGKAIYILNGVKGTID